MYWFYRDIEESSVIVDDFRIKALLLNFTSGFFNLSGNNSLGGQSPGVSTRTTIFYNYHASE